MIARLRGDAARIPLADGSVHAVVTSPPYFGLRKYAGVSDTVWGGDPSHPHVWGAMEKGRRKDISPADVSTAGRLGTDERTEGALNDGGRFCSCGAWRGCLGEEPDVNLYVEHLVAVFRDIRRVLRDDGVCWLNLGDSFAAGSRTTYDSDDKAPWREGEQRQPSDIPAGNLLGVPWRVALALQADGWLLRNDPIWAKVAPMPESVSGWRFQRCRRKVAGGNRAERPAVTPARQNSAQSDHDGHGFAPSALWEDCPGCEKCEPGGGYVLRRGSWRHTRAHEYVFMLAKGPGYFCDSQAVQEAATMTSGGRLTAALRGDAGKRTERPEGTAREGRGLDTGGVDGRRNPRSVIWLGPEPLREAHYAAFPTALVEPLLRASTPARGCCAKCRAPWAPVVERPAPTVGVDYAGKNATQEPQAAHRKLLASVRAARGAGGEHNNPFPSARTTGWRATCACPASEPVPAVVLDPFAGSGTVGRVAIGLGLRAVLLDLSQTYLRDIADSRTRNVQVELAL